MSKENPNSPNDENPDWLNNLKPEDDESSDFDQSREDDSSSFGDEDLLGNLSSQSAEESEEETPDWLQNIREKEGTAGLKSSDADQTQEDLGWLENIKNQEENISINYNDSESDELAFLDKIQSFKDNQAVEEGNQDDLNWVEGLDKTKEISDLNPIESEAIEKANEDWLSTLTESENATSSGIKKEAEIKDLPKEQTQGEILEDNNIQPNDSQSEQHDDTFPFADDSIKELQTIDTSSLPSWLVALQKNSPEVRVPIEKELPVENEPPIEKELPIEKVPVSNPVFETIDEDTSLLMDDADIPDWLSNISPADDHNVVDDSPLPIAPLHIVSEQEPESVDDLEPESDGLPSWLNALKPDDINSAEGDDEDAYDEINYEGQEETYGPLSGLRNLLPAEPDIVHFGKPSQPITNFEFTDSLVNKSKILYQLVTAEEDSIKINRRKISAPKPIMRILIALFLYIGIFIPTLIDSKSLSFPNPNFPPQEIVDVAQSIINLPDEGTVLVAFEYQPGLSGEIEAATSGMIDYLNLKGSKIVTLYTQPSGQGLVEKFFARLNIPYTNLGYISGGMAALSNFSHYPQSTINPILTNQNQFLSSILGINDFDMVIVLTDSADTGRAWVEQVEPLLIHNETPLIMGISAQAEPLLSPYYINEPKQITGYSSGITGGAFFEQYVGRENIARSYWNSYGAGLSISILILSIGSIYNIFSALIKKKGNK